MAAAYAALVSLMNIIHQIEHHPSPPISLDKQQADSLTQIVTFLQEFLEAYNSHVEEADLLESRIADAAYAAEDVIESYIVDNIQLAASTGFNDEQISFIKFYQDLQQVIVEMDLIKKAVVENIEEKAVIQDHQLQRDVSESVGSLISSSTGQNNINNMVGFDGVLLEIMDKLTGGGLSRQIIPIVGMGGIGKTTLALNIYVHPLTKEHFDIWAWATISQQYNTAEILCEVLSQASKESKERLSKMSEDELGLTLYKYLSCRRYIIVMDDMWSIKAWEKMQFFFPDNKNSSRIVVTTRLSKLGSQLDNNYGLEMKFLDENSSWDLFSRIVFGEKGTCPLELEEIGKKIVEICRGLPLSIVVMGGLLQKLNHTQECWESITKDLNSTLLNLGNNEYCMKILKMSYDHLPAYLKPCFLYMGVFEEDREIRVSTFVKLCVSEGFLKPVSGKSLEVIVEEYLKDLVERNLILVHKLGSIGNIKYFKIHDLLRDLCLREAQKEGFYHAMRQYTPQVINRQRRIVTSEEIQAIDALECLSHARSYICNNEKVVLFPNLRLLRILKAYDRDTIYHNHEYFLEDVFQLANARYLAVRGHWKSKFPSSISLLWNLHTLIVAHSEVVTAPVEIWKMPQLRHVEFNLGVYLPNPPADMIIMENLQTLMRIMNFKCGDEVVKRIPNIKKLVMREFERDIDEYHCLSNLECLHKLEYLCYWDPIGSNHHLQKLTFPQSLKKLSIYVGHVFEWEEMLEKIGSLPLLQKLKLGGGYFKTRTWETVEGRFTSLKFLELMQCGLEYWTTESAHFPCLEILRLHGLVELKEIPFEIGEIPTLKSIKLKACSESVVKSAKKMIEEQEKMQGEEQLPFHVRVLLGNKNQALQKLASSNFEVDSSKAFA